MPFSYPIYVGALRPHLGHKLTWKDTNGEMSIHCFDCDKTISDSTPGVPKHIEFVKPHVGHTMNCHTADMEINVNCECGTTVASSTPF